MSITKLRQIIRETTKQMVVASKDPPAVKIEKAIGRWGKYAVSSLIEDYEYYTNRDGQYFVSTLSVSQDPDGTVHVKTVGYDLTWNPEEKKWEGDGFVEDTSPLLPDNPDVLGWPEEFHPDFDMDVFDENSELIERFPGAVEGLRNLLNKPGMAIHGEKIDAEGYLGMSDLFITDLDGKTTIGIQHKSNSFTWDPETEEWI